MASPKTPTLTENNGQITIVNDDDRDIVALDFWHVVDGRRARHQSVINFDMGDDPAIKAHSSLVMGPGPWRYNGLLTLELNGVLFADGTIIGENTWHVERFAAMRNDVYAGRTAYLTKKPFAGDSHAAFSLLVMMLHARVSKSFPVHAEDKVEPDESEEISWNGTK